MSEKIQQEPGEHRVDEWNEVAGGEKFTGDEADKNDAEERNLRAETVFSDEAIEELIRQNVESGRIEAEDSEKISWYQEHPESAVHDLVDLPYKKLVEERRERRMEEAREQAHQAMEKAREMMTKQENLSPVENDSEQETNSSRQEIDDSSREMDVSGQETVLRPNTEDEILEDRKAKENQINLTREVRNVEKARGEVAQIQEELKKYRFFKGLFGRGRLMKENLKIQLARKEEDLKRAKHNRDFYASGAQTYDVTRIRDGQDPYAMNRAELKSVEGGLPSNDTNNTNLPKAA